MATDREDRHPYREGLLIFAAMILSGILTVTVSVWIVGGRNLIGISVRDPAHAEQVRQRKADGVRDNPRPAIPLDQR